MRDCDACGAELRAMDSYLALEGFREVEVTRWACPGCGLERETAEPVLEVA